MFKGNFEATVFAWNKRVWLSRKNGTGFSQNDLAKFVGEFDGELDVGERQVARVREAAGKRSDFLIQKIFSAAESQVFDL